MEQPKDLSNIKNIYLKTNLGVLDIMSELPPVRDFEVIKKNGELEKYITKVKALGPDIALLIFENFVDKEEDAAQVRKDLEAVKNTILKETGLESSALVIVVASDTPDFNEYDDDFGITGSKLNAINWS